MDLHTVRERGQQRRQQGVLEVWSEQVTLDRYQEIRRVRARLR
jgi:hypothetical protein